MEKEAVSVLKLRGAIANVWMFLLFTLVALVVTADSQGGLRITDPSETAALLAFRNGLTNKESVLLDWVSTTDPCNSRWTGVFCDSNDQPTDNTVYQHVTELRLLGLNLEGPLAPDLGGLSALLTLDLMVNNISGSIPPELGKLVRLQVLTLTSNSLSGIIPQELGSLVNMNRIQLDENQISGQVPATFGNLVSLAHLHLNNNSLNGSIPKELGQLPKLIHILLDNNNLSGELPVEIANATTLVIVQLDNNQFEGNIPPDYATNLTSLTKLSCRNCSLWGQIPDLSNLTLLNVLDLSLNNFNGTIPNIDMTNVTTINLSHNQLADGIPDFLVAQDGKLQLLRLDNNKLSGDIKNFAAQMNYTVNEQLLDFQNNSFSYISLGLITESAHEPNLYLRLSGNSEICDGSKYIPELDNLCQPVVNDQNIDASSGDTNRIPRGGPIVIKYRLKSPGFSYFTNSYQIGFREYIASGLAIDETQVVVQSYEWQPGPRLMMILLINPPGNTKFNDTEVERIGKALANWKAKNSTLYGPYELLGFDFLGKGKSKLSKGTMVGIVLGGIAILVLIFLALLLLALRKRMPLTPAERRRAHMLSLKASQQSMLKITGVLAFTYKELAQATDDFSESKEASQQSMLKITGVLAFTYKELAQATDDFSESKEVGRGGYGKVYRGVLESGQVVAIKRANTEAIQRNTEFYNEIELLSRCHHRNLVALVGYCHDEEEQMLVYEFMEGGTLHDHLSAAATTHLDFATRIRLALGSAKGILYLHTEANPPIFHRDIKSNNILLDEKRHAKVADFGLSRLAPEIDDEGGETSASHVSTVVKGTPGYLDPEYFLTRKLTDKSDVYSFGVVLLELITGMQPISFGKNIVREVKASYENGELLKVIDTRMGSYPAEIMEPFAKLAIACVNNDTDARPTMQEVTRILENLAMNTQGRGGLRDMRSMDISRDDYSSLTRDHSFKGAPIIEFVSDGRDTEHSLAGLDSEFGTGSSRNQPESTSCFVTVQEQDYLTPR